MAFLNSLFLNSLGLQRPSPPPCAAQGRFDIAGVTVINPARDRRAGAKIGIADGTITGISEEALGAASEFAGCFALPGLIDMHVHLPPDNALKLTAGATLLYLLHGVTSLREAGDLDGTAVEAARRLSREGVHPVPRVFCCGPFVGAGKATFTNTILLEDASDATAEAAALRVTATGASFMKFHDGLTEPMIRALERACARHGLKMMGHVPAALSYEDARIAEVQHFFGVPEPSTLERNALINRSCDWRSVDERRMDAIVEATLKFGIANTPTIVTNQRILGYLDYDAACRRRDRARTGLEACHPRCRRAARRERIGSRRGRGPGRYSPVPARSDAGDRPSVDPRGSRGGRKALSCRRSQSRAAIKSCLLRLAADQAAGPPRRRTGARTRDRVKLGPERGLYLRVKSSLASIDPSLFNPAALSAAAAGSPGLFHHGNFASIPRLTGSPSAPPKSTGQNPFGTTSAVTSPSR